MTTSPIIRFGTKAPSAPSLPAPCPTCGHQYDVGELHAHELGQVVLDPTPTHLCRPVQRVHARELFVGQRVFIPHHFGEEMHGDTRGTWCVVEDLPGAHKQNPTEWWLRPARRGRGYTPFFAYLYGEVTTRG